jgi:hypothetical protein
MADHTTEGDHHPEESPLLRAQEHKGYGEDEGERDVLLEDEAEAEDEQLPAD